MIDPFTVFALLVLITCAIVFALGIWLEIIDAPPFYQIAQSIGLIGGMAMLMLLIIRGLVWLANYITVYINS
jgi:hypothetical protein